MHRTTIAKYTKFSTDELQKSLSDPLSCVTAVQLNEILSLRPRDCEHIVKGVRRSVTDKIGRYHPKVNGIVLGYAKIRVDNALSALRLDSPFLHVRATIDYYIFQPRIGSPLQGTVNYISKQFVSAMIYRVFNVTVKLGNDIKRQKTLTKGMNISFIVKSCDMKSEIPVIEGELVVDEVTTSTGPRIKQEPGEDTTIGSSTDEEQEDISMEEDAVDSAPSIVKHAPKTKKTRTEKKPKNIVNGSTGSVQLDTAIDSSDESEDEKSVYIKSLLGEMFGDEFKNGDSKKKHKKKKEKSSKKKSNDETVTVKQEPISTDEEEALGSRQNASTSNVGSGLSNGTNGFRTNGSLTSSSKKKHQPAIPEIKTEPTESKKKKKLVE
ncbi:probable DNA-directed RNA polymerase I subunit RPA43 [Anopheles funestus]|uniref:probable DNA-directed RNA polymerase I subunit RPA43 n=1 Tax=Anopheles funestus TaxID=62324 RepID=UPI0020C72383|nr:probable DNA-directed RNA polymerase I subunit RPA43 [Anopheles funestus]